MKYVLLFTFIGIIMQWLITILLFRLSSDFRLRVFTFSLLSPGNVNVEFTILVFLAIRTPLIMYKKLFMMGRRVLNDLEYVLDLYSKLCPIVWLVGPPYINKNPSNLASNSKNLEGGRHQIHTLINLVKISLKALSKSKQSTENK